MLLLFLFLFDSFLQKIQPPEVLYLAPLSSPQNPLFGGESYKFPVPRKAMNMGLFFITQ